MSNYLHGTKPFLRNSDRSMECNGSLPCSKQPAIRPVIEPCKSNPPSHPVSLRFILILFSHLRLRLPSGLISSGSFTKSLYAYLLSHTRVICPVYPIFCSVTIIIFYEEYKSWSASLWNVLQLPLISCTLIPDNLVNTLLLIHVVT
jgi:hypothetical protein